MKVRIFDVKIEKYTCKVNFISQYGNSNAIWIGEFPKINNLYDVEFEVIKSYNWQTDIISVEEEPKLYFSKDAGTYIIGFLESIDKDGCAGVRIGSELLLLETKGNPIKLKSKIKFLAEELYLYEVKY